LVAPGVTRVATSVACAVSWPPLPRTLVTVDVSAASAVALAMRSANRTVVFAWSRPLFVDRSSLPWRRPELGGILLLTGDGEKCGEDVAHTYMYALQKQGHVLDSCLRKLWLSTLCLVHMYMYSKKF
jgi:hypothetical protein